jgi:hypothetical protein
MHANSVVGQIFHVEMRHSAVTVGAIVVDLHRSRGAVLCCGVVLLLLLPQHSRIGMHKTMGLQSVIRP